MFEKTLTDLIRGLRANKTDEKRYIQLAIAECRREAKSQDVDVKAGAILKLTYLAMFGQDMAWASFTTVEVMASPKFINKRIGYMAAAQGFRQDTDVLMLSTNQMKKDLGSSNASDGSIALSALADIATPDLARDLSHDVIAMLGHSKSSVRKKAVLVMYKIFLQYPEALRSSYPKLRERLEDTDHSVVSATVNVITELSRRNPKNYLTLAPTLFELLTTSTNNWMLIKIIKLFATLTPLEPRLTKKLITPLTDLIQSTPAMSLLYECINTVISGDILQAPNSDGLARLCNAKLSDFFEQSDQNLKYVAIIALTKLSKTHPELVSSHQAEILACVDDADLSIRLRALELVCLMPTKKSLPDIVKRLVLQLLPNGLNLPDQHRRDLVLRLIKMCRMENYKHVDDFDWYVAVLFDLVKVSKVDVGEELRDELHNVCVRVRSVREFAVPTLERLLHNRDILEHADDPTRNAAALTAAAWAVGEYSTHLEDPRQTLNNLLAAPKSKLDPSVLCGYLQAIPKLFSRWAADLGDMNDQLRSELALQIDKVQRVVSEFSDSTDIEVQRRAVELVQLFQVAAQVVAEAEPEADSLPFFSEILPNLYFSGGDLNPIAPSAQRAIPVPIELDLDSWIVQPTPEPSPVLAPVDMPSEVDEEELAEEQRLARIERNRDDPFYIPTEFDRRETEKDDQLDTHLDINVEDVPVSTLDQPLRIKRKKRRPNEPVVILDDERPEGHFDEEQGSSAARVPSKESNILKVDGSKLSAFDLDAPVPEEEDEEMLAAYRAMQAKPKVSGSGTKTDFVKPKKKKKKKVPKQEAAVASEPEPQHDVVEVVKKKRRKKPVEIV